MAYYVLGDPTYQTSNWYNNILEGLIEMKRQKRFSLIVLEHPDSFNQITVTCEDIIFVIGTNNIWLSQILPTCEAYFENRVILLGNNSKCVLGGTYSTVTSNISHDIELLYAYLLSYHKKRIALYGINPESASDSFRKESFLSCGATATDIFYNIGSLTTCYHDFSERSSDYDAVICANDYAAISLVRHLPQKTKLFITSCGGSLLLTRFFTPSITHTYTDYKAFGKVGFDLCQILLKNQNICSVNIRLSSLLSVGDTTEHLPPSDNVVLKNHAPQKTHDAFYSDTEVNEMLRIEMLLNACDENDFTLLNDIRNNMTYAQIAEKMFLSTSGVKYKLKNMFQICHVTSRNEFVTLLNKYL